MWFSSVTLFEMVDETYVNNTPRFIYYTNIAVSVSVAGTQSALICIKSESAFHITDCYLARALNIL
jgi:hypothetical protein